MTPGHDTDDAHAPTAQPGEAHSPSATPPAISVERAAPGIVATLAEACRLAPAESAALMERGADGTLRVVATFPATSPEWLASCQEQALQAIATAAPSHMPFHTGEDLYGQPPRYHVAIQPLAAGGRAGQCAAFLLAAPTPKALQAARDRLAIAVALFELGDTRVALAERTRAAARLSTAIDVLAAVQRHARFLPAAMALANEVASRWACDRAGFGLLKGRYVELRALNASASFSRKTKLVIALEAAMEECLDQDVEVVLPAAPGTAASDHAHRELTTLHGPAAVASFPLRQDGEPAGAFLVERPADRPFGPEEVLALRLTLELCAPVLLRLDEGEHLFGTRTIRRVGAAVLGAKRTETKLIVLLLLAAALVLVFGHGTHRVEAPFVLKAETERVLPAPFDGYLESAAVRPGDSVSAGTTVLATLSTVELQLQLASAKAEQATYLKEASAELSGHDPAKEQIARAQADKAAARIDLIEHQLAQARITTPIDGTIVTGDLREKVGAPVRQGDVLFEVASLDSLYAQAYVPDEEIGFLAVGQKGDLATAAFATERIEVTVDRIEPIAEVVDRRNVFRVRLRLARRPAWMRPGMEGVSRLSIGTRTYGWLAFHRFADWLRMTFWL